MVVFTDAPYSGSKAKKFAMLWKFSLFFFFFISFQLLIVGEPLHLLLPWWNSAPNSAGLGPLSVCLSVSLCWLQWASNIIKRQKWRIEGCQLVFDFLVGNILILWCSLNSVFQRAPRWAGSYWAVFVHPGKMGRGPHPAWTRQVGARGREDSALCSWLLLPGAPSWGSGWTEILYWGQKWKENQDKEICRAWGGPCSTRAAENSDNEVACSWLPNVCRALAQARWS